MEQKEPPKPRYRLYCPNHFSNRDTKGFDTFDNKYFHSDGNVIDHLKRYGTMMRWYQIVDIRNDFKVIKEKAPIIEL